MASQPAESPPMQLSGEGDFHLGSPGNGKGKGAGKCAGKGARGGTDPPKGVRFRALAAVKSVGPVAPRF